jgi:hypothetical protein
MSAAAPEHAGAVKKPVKHARQAVLLLDACVQDADRLRDARGAVRRWAGTAEGVRVD